MIQSAASTTTLIARPFRLLVYVASTSKHPGYRSDNQIGTLKALGRLGRFESVKPSGPWPVR
jgi:hypothetical protein